MPDGLKRFQEAQCLHFITFSCYHRAPLLTSPDSRRFFEQTLEQVRRWYVFVTGYVVMPEHVHLLLSEPEHCKLSTALQMLKQITAHQLISHAPAGTFWQAPNKQNTAARTAASGPGPGRALSSPRCSSLGLPPFSPFPPPFPPSPPRKRYYDFNVWSEHKHIEKLRYIHRNPVKRGLCENPEDWEWSSFRHHLSGIEGTVEIESQWTARKREQQGVTVPVTRSA